MICAISLMTMIASPALAADYTFGGVVPTTFGAPTSVDPVTVIGGESSSGENTNKNTAVTPPPFGSGYPGSVSRPPASPSAFPTEASPSGSSFTLPDGLFYSDGSLGTLKIPSLGVSVKVYEEESLENLKKGAGHFKSTSCWEGNAAFAAHNRGANDFFGKIHTLSLGARIEYTTKLGTRVYEVSSVRQIHETDVSCLNRSDTNMVTLITCVRDIPELRWCVQAVELR